MKIAKAEAQPGAGEAADSLPLLITAHTEPLSLAALHAAMTDAGAAWLSAEGLRADTAQRAESRFYAFYRTAGEIAAAHGMGSPSKVRHIRYPLLTVALCQLRSQLHLT